jgi:hypothetical protein
MAVLFLVSCPGLSCPGDPALQHGDMDNQQETRGQHDFHVPRGFGFSNLQLRIIHYFVTGEDQMLKMLEGR